MFDFEFEYPLLHNIFLGRVIVSKHVKSGVDRSVSLFYSYVRHTKDNYGGEAIRDNGFRCRGKVRRGEAVYGCHSRRVLSSDAVNIRDFYLSTIVNALINERWPSSTPIF